MAGLLLIGAAGLVGFELLFEPLFEARPKLAIEAEKTEAMKV